MMTLSGFRRLALFAGRSVICVAATLLVIPRGCVVEAEDLLSMHLDVVLRNRIDPDEVINMDCMLNDDLIGPKGFLTSASGSSVNINEQLGPEDAIYCDFTLGFVPKDLIQVAVKCTPYVGCSPMSMDFTSEGVYFNITNGIPPGGQPDQPWGTLLPSSHHNAKHLEP